MTVEYDINAYEMNQVTLYSVQGEAESRTVIFNIIEKSGIQIPTSNATVINKMLDLSDYTAKLYIIRPDNSIVSCDGTIANATNGTVSFILSEDCMKFSGIAECAIVFTKENTNLRVVGISLQIAVCNIDGNSVNSGNYTVTEYSTGTDVITTESKVSEYEITEEVNI